MLPTGVPGVEDRILTFAASALVGGVAIHAGALVTGDARGIADAVLTALVGAVVWAVVCGHPPFEEEFASDILQRHLEEPLPAFRPAMPVPEGLEAWLHRLLQKSPEDRFQRAADAAWGLLGLGDPTAPDLEVASVERSGTDRPTLEQLDMALAETEPNEAPPEWSAQTDGGQISPDRSIEPMPVAVPPVPDSWERGGRRRGEEVQGGRIIGERLLGLRRVPFVDRNAIRARMWKTLRRVSRNRRPEAIVLEGPEGFGKSRLASWCTRRAHELGAAEVLKARYSRGAADSPQDGLGPMFARYYLCVGLNEEAIIQELAERDRGPAFEASAGQSARGRLAGMMAVTDWDESSSMNYTGFASRQSRHRIAAEVIGEIAGRRTAIVWLDDVQHSQYAVDFCRYLSDDCDGDRPVLFVLTADDTSIERSDRAREKIRQFSHRDLVEHLEVGPLTPRDTERLVVKGLGLAEESAAATARLAEGNPLFAIEMVRHWAEVGALAQTADGFAVDEPALADVPEDVRRVWILRLDEMLDEMPTGDAEPARLLLVLGALLGRRVREREWRRAAERYPEVDFGFDRLLRPIVRRGLLVSDDDGWAFTHGLLREALRDWYDDPEKVRTLQAAIGTALVDCHGQAPSTESERIGNHFLAAGKIERALTHIGRGLDWYLADGQAEEFRRVLARYREIAERLEPGSESRRRAKLRAELFEQSPVIHLRTVRAVVEVGERLARGTSRMDPAGVIRVQVGDRFAGNLSDVCLYELCVVVLLVRISAVGVNVYPCNDRDI
ncbi:MAG: hypothetical protein ABEN55_14265, partial [Bradymonadaceae bacterium]